MKRGTGFTAEDLSGARKVAESFLQAAVRGDEATARGMISLADGESLDFKSMHESIAGFELGEARADGSVVVAVATVRAKPGKDAPPPLPLVLNRAGKGWTIDMGASINRMMGGVDIEALMQQMAQGLGDAMAESMKGLGDAMAQGLGAMEGGASSPGKKGAKTRPTASKPKAKPRPAGKPKPGKNR